MTFDPCFDVIVPNNETRTRQHRTITLERLTSSPNLTNPKHQSLIVSLVEKCTDFNFHPTIKERWRAERVFDLIQLILVVSDLRLGSGTLCQLL